jgi:two-component system, cell cycle sensor histidine kinase and response regulator CckA
MKRGESGPTILLIEDDDVLLQLLAFILERAGYHVLQASRGSQALEIAAAFAGTIHVVVSDVVMPGMSGPETVRRLRATRQLGGVLYISGYRPGDISDYPLHDDGALFMQKPVRAPDLLSRVAELLASAPPA